MTNLIRKRNIAGSFNSLILKIYEFKNRFKFSIQIGDGNGNGDGMTPFLKSGYQFDSPDDAEADAEDLIEIYMDPDPYEIEIVKTDIFRSIPFKITKCRRLFSYFVDLGDELEPLYSNFQYRSATAAKREAIREIKCELRSR